MHFLFRKVYNRGVLWGLVVKLSLKGKQVSLSDNIESNKWFCRYSIPCVIYPWFICDPGIFAVFLLYRSSSIDTQCKVICPWYICPPPQSARTNVLLTLFWPWYICRCPNTSKRETDSLLILSDSPPTQVVRYKNQAPYSSHLVIWCLWTWIRLLKVTNC